MIDTDTELPADRKSGKTLLSICVPTFNREEFLDEFLERLAGFEHLNYEVVISDNASDDGTANVALKWRPYVKNLYYLKQEKTLTPPENVCAVCNAARGDYIFRIADDDLLLEDGLLAAMQILDEDASCAAVYGSWHICDFNFDRVEHRNDYTHTRIRQSQPIEMYYQFWTVELPMFRRTLFQRHMLGYTKQLPLDFHAAGRFLNHGDLIFIPDLVAKIRGHPGQDSQELYGFRLLQEYLTDCELFLSEVPNMDTQDMVSALLHKTINTYITAARRAISHGKFLDARAMMKKALAYRIEGTSQMAIAFEKAHLPAVLADYIFELCRLNPTIERLFFEQTLDAATFLPAVERKLEGRATVRLITKTELLALPQDETALVVAQDATTMAQRLKVPGANPAKHRCLDDLVDACSLF